MCIYYYIIMWCILTNVKRFLTLVWTFLVSRKQSRWGGIYHGMWTLKLYNEILKHTQYIHKHVSTYRERYYYTYNAIGYSLLFVIKLFGFCKVTIIIIHYIIYTKQAIENNVLQSLYDHVQCTWYIMSLQLLYCSLYKLYMSCCKY